jgi:DNA-binding IclR family transcriptional regulator
VQYVQIILNKGDAWVTLEQYRFIDDMGGFFASYGLGHAPGRVYGYLLLRPGLASLDEIAADLGISKSGASTAARLLETWHLVRRVPERGSRRIRYAPTTALDRLLVAGIATVQAFRQTLDEGRQVAPSGAPIARLEDLSNSRRLYLDAVEDALRRVKEGTTR